VGVVGSRDYDDEAGVRAYLASLPAGTVVVSGGRTAEHWPDWRGAGVDVWAAEAAEAAGLPLVEVRPDGRLGTPGCFHARNRAIVDAVTLAVARGESGWLAAFTRWPPTPGTASTIGLARAAGLDVFTLGVPGPGVIAASTAAEIVGLRERMPLAPVLEPVGVTAGRDGNEPTTRQLDYARRLIAGHNITAPLLDNHCRATFGRPYRDLDRRQLSRLIDELKAWQEHGAAFLQDQSDPVPGVGVAGQAALFARSSA
jgi:hypothetical protein